jgi:hypothetical protein
MGFSQSKFSLDGGDGPLKAGYVAMEWLHDFIILLPAQSFTHVITFISMKPNLIK